MPTADHTERLTTARNILEKQGRLSPEVVAARVAGVIVDLHTPVAEDAAPEAVLEQDPAALEVIRHSCAHVMADAVQRLFPGTKVAIGPAIDDGFYYDFDHPAGAFTEADLQKIEDVMAEIVAKDEPFRRDEMSREDARRLFEGMGEKYKLEILDKVEEPVSVYRHGGWVDLCRGPHVPSTRFLKAVKLTSVAGAYWRGDERYPMLQRVYGTAFASADDLRQHLDRLAQAKQRDHRKLGKELDLIAFHPWAPASPFFLPRGADVYNRLADYIRGLYRAHGYQEVITPQIFDAELFRMSGHLPTYAESLFFALTAEDIEAAEKAAPGRVRESIRFAVKPMNCPGHALLFGMTKHSYRELPIRMADFGRLHRFERSGVVQGLTRVRTFSQDDAHIFCTMSQMQDEIAGFIDLVYAVYRDFGFTSVRVVIATRPDKRLGTEAMWDAAERALDQAVRVRDLPCEVAAGEGAFYGPKIEFHLKDALGRPWQLGTVQVDFNLPERFGLTYVGEDNTEHRPVVLHRAILGSVERFFGVLVEHVGGAFPTWLAPDQVVIVTVSEKVDAYARKVLGALTAAGLRARADLSGEKLGAKIRSARLMRVPYIAVVGQKEAESESVSVRSRDENKDLGSMPLAQLIERVRAEGLAPSARSA